MQYIVFAVDQADRLTLMGPPKDGAPNLKAVALSFIQAPHQGRRMASGDFIDDEPYGYEAAELIRNKFIGKPVRFKEDYFIQKPQQRIAGRMSLVDGDLDATCLLLGEGLAAIPLQMPPGMDKNLFQRYVDIMRGAFLSSKGIFAAEKEQARHVRRLKNLPVEKLAERVSELIGKEVRVRVERILTGVSLVLTAPEFEEVPVPAHLTGVSVKGLEEEFTAAARFFAERYLLHRHVTVRFDGLDGHGNAQVSVISSKGSFQEEMLSQGLCKVVTATVTISPDVQRLLEAEAKAKEGRRGTWRHYVSPTASTVAAVTTVTATEGGEVVTAAGGVKSVGAARHDGIPTFLPNGQPGPAYKGPANFTGKLVQVIHADTLVIREEESQQQIRVGLAGIRCSKAVTRDQDGNSPETRVTYSELAWESREFVRTRYIGWQVSVQVEYARVMNETKELRPAVVVTNAENGVNIGTALLEEGLATFFLGKNGTCRCAAEFQAAEADAKAAGKGVHSDVDPAPTKILELSHLGESRSRYYLSFLQRGMQGTRPPMLRGVVDVVVSGNSVRVYIPKEHFQIPVRLAGVIAPAGATNSQNAKADRFYEESRNFVVDLLQQREASLQVFSSDRAGNFIGALTLDNGTNVSVALVQAGLATVGNADRLPFVNQLLEAEESAKAAARCVWSATENLPQRAAKMESRRAARGGAFTPVTGRDAVLKPYIRTEVAEDGLSVYLQPCDEETAEAKAIIRDLLDTLLTSTSDPPHKPSVGQILAVQYTGDQEWHRAKVLRLTSTQGEPAALVQFIDYGNTQTTKFSAIRSIPRMGDYVYLLDTPPLAFQAKLAYVKQRLPTNAEELSFDLAYEYTEREVLAKPEYEDLAGTVYYTVTWSEKNASLNEELLQNGAAFLEKKAALLSSAYERHAAANQIARKSHVGVWAYGDADEDDDV